MPIRIISKKGFDIAHITIHGVLTKNGQLMTIREHKKYMVNNEAMIYYNNIEYGKYCCAKDHLTVVDEIRKTNNKLIDSVLIKCIMELKQYDRSDVLERIRVVSEDIKE